MEELLKDTFAKLWKAEAQYERAITELEDVTTSLRDFKVEVVRMLEWRVRAEIMDASIQKLDLVRFDRLPLFRYRFTRAVEELRKAGEAYLKQPETL